LKFTKDELEGVSDDFLKQAKTGENEYTVDGQRAASIHLRDDELR